MLIETIHAQGVRASPRIAQLSCRTSPGGDCLPPYSPEGPHNVLQRLQILFARSLQNIVDSHIAHVDLPRHVANNYCTYSLIGRTGPCLGCVPQSALWLFPQPFLTVSVLISGHRVLAVRVRDLGGGSPFAYQQRELQVGSCCRSLER